ncbi:MAG: YegS/Rv2252/BmrU family lipid kinase [Ruminococcaceae bacterium]|nr:YegS/Rv2252/BmrU family lipid kinase [Oscillospiraceae bacterium]
MKHIFVINAVSRSKAKRKKLFNTIVDICKNENITYDIYFTKGVGDAYNYAREIALQGAPVRFYGCGGDGTVNELASACAHIPTAQFTVIPMGSGNDFARSFGGSKNFNDIVSLIYGNPIEIDLIKINDRYCANITNIGFDRRVVAATNKVKKTKIIKGSAAYICGVIVTLLQHKKEMLHFKFDDGSEFTKRFLVSIFANASYYGGGFCACPEASLFDGEFDVLIMPPIGRLRFISLVGKFRQGRLMESEFAQKHVFYKKCTKVNITRATPIKYCIDGELLKANEINLEIDPKAVNFVVPADVTINE